MKKNILLTIFCVFCTLFPVLAPYAACADSSTYAEADRPTPYAEEENFSQYARIEQAGVYLYATTDEMDGLFTLPRTYFVRILGETSQYYYVSYLADKADFKAVRGYCKKTEITPVDYQPETPYLEYKITITYSVEGGGILPDDPLSTFTAQAAYYGAFHFGTSVHYYVYREGAFGYVPAKSCSVPDYPINTEHTAPVTPPEDNKTNNSSAPRNNAVRIVLICTLSVFAIGAIYFLFRPQKTSRPPRNPFYDENENY